MGLADFELTKPDQADVWTRALWSSTATPTNQVKNRLYVDSLDGFSISLPISWEVVEIEGTTPDVKSHLLRPRGLRHEAEEWPHLTSAGIFVSVFSNTNDPDATLASGHAMVISQGDLTILLRRDDTYLRLYVPKAILGFYSEAELTPILQSIQIL